MKLLSQDGAVATLYVIPDEVKPLKGLHLPAVIHAIAERYKPAKIPTLEEVRASGAKFENALFRAPDRDITITLLGLYNDAISVTTTDTADSDLVLDDVYKWLKAEFQFRDPQTPPLRLYQSDLVVSFERDPAEAFAYLAPFLEAIQEQMTPQHARFRKQVSFNAIVFGTDPTAPGPTPEFTLARRVNTPWDLKIYFSKAHMQTAAHVRALELLEQLLHRSD